MQTSTDQNGRLLIVSRIRLLRVSRTEDRRIEAIAEATFRPNSRESERKLCVLVTEPFRREGSDLTLRHRLLQQVLDRVSEVLGAASETTPLAQDVP